MGADTQLLKDSLDHIIRVGRVVGREEGSLRVRVEVPDTTTGALTSYSLQVLTPRAKEDMVYDLPDIGDQVVSLFMPNGKEVGFVLGSMYPDTQQPPVGSGDKWHRTFKDGTTLEYDRDKHELTAVVKGRADVKADKDIKATAGTTIEAQASDFISLKAPTIKLSGNIKAEGHDLDSDADITERGRRHIVGQLIVDGKLTVNGQSEVNGNHTTSGNSHAGSRSGGPI